MKELKTTKEITRGTITFKITLIRRDSEIANLDGDKVEIKKYNEFFNIDVIKDGKTVTWSAYRPFIIKNRTKNTPDGAYAELNNQCYLSEETYNIIDNIINAMYAETESEEIIIAMEVAKEKQAKKEEAERIADAQYEKNIKNGMCPKCGTWCYGECEL